MIKLLMWIPLLWIWTENPVNCDVNRSWIGFQNIASPVLEGIIDLHDHILFFLIIILIIVLYLFLEVFLKHLNLPYKEFLQRRKVLSDDILELLWTILPALILVLIGIPSFSILYAMDEVINPNITIKIEGHQWYWSYEYELRVKYSDITRWYMAENKGIDLSKEFSEPYYKKSEDINWIRSSMDSYLIHEEELKTGDLRLLETDTILVVPSGVNIRFIVTADDVIHSWTIPSWGVKVDAVPGRLNQFFVYVSRPGVYYGQCSEICGVGHGFMPIKVISIPFEEWVKWIMKK